MGRPKSGYHLKDGTRVPGVTTVTGRFKKADALIFWAFKQGKAAERGEIKSLYEKRDVAAEAGTLCHDMVEAHIKNQPLPSIVDYPGTIINKAERGFQNYLDWEKNNKIQIVHTEMPMVSEKYKFGGTPDGIGLDTKRRLCILDWKTSDKGPFVDWIIQLAAYGVLWEENNPNMPIRGGYHLCRFSKQHADFHHHYWSELDDAWNQFHIFLEAYRYDKILKERV